MVPDMKASFLGPLSKLKSYTSHLPRMGEVVLMISKQLAIETPIEMEWPMMKLCNGVRI